MKRFITIFILIFIYQISKGQIIESKYNFLSLYPSLINPAYYGNSGKIDFYLGQKIQWVGLKDAPENFNFCVNSPIYDNMAVGVRIKKQSLGIFNAFTFNAGYSYKFLLAGKHSIALGIDFNYVQNSTSISSLSADELQDPAMYSPVLLQDNFYSGIGVLYNYDKFYFGVSSPVVYDIKTDDAFQYNYIFTYYDFYVKDKMFIIQPSVFTKIEGWGFKYADCRLKVDYKQRVFVQFGYRTLNEFAYSIGFQFNNFIFSYSYEHGGRDLAPLSKGTHEVALIFSLDKSKLSKSQ